MALRKLVKLLQFSDSASDPSADGELQRNGSDVKVHTGGNVKNLSNIGSGGGGGDPTSAFTEPVAFTSIPDQDWISIPVYVPSGKSFTLRSWGSRTDSGTTPTGLNVEVYDADAGTVAVSGNTAFTTGSNLHTVSGNADLHLRLRNNTGNSVTAGGRFGYDLE